MVEPDTLNEPPPVIKSEYIDAVEPLRILILPIISTFDVGFSVPKPTNPLVAPVPCMCISAVDAVVAP